MVRVLYFAWLRERAGRAEEQLDLPPGVGTVGALAAWLRARDAKGAAAFTDLATVRAAVNQVFAPPDAPIADGDEVAFFPPVTGG
jgi:molybdopterin synthase sulfur carrier subunit